MARAPALPASTGLTGVDGAGAPSFYLTERERYLLGVVLQLRSRGWGSYRVGRLLWPSLPPRTAQKRVQRLLERARRMGLPVDRPGEALRLLSSASLDFRERWGGVETPGPPFVETTRRRVETGEDGSGRRARGSPPARRWRPPRLGRTQRLVVAALRSLGGRARLAAVVQEVLSLLGLEGHLLPRSRLRNRVWQALRRLARRGLVGFHRGVYWLQGALGGPGLYVENLRARTYGGRVVQVWSKREHGYAAPLEEALALATLRGAARVVQAEVAEVLRSPELERAMEELGVSIIKVYRDPAPPYRSRAKLEIVLNSSTPLKPSILELNTWTKAFQTIKQALLKALRKR